MGTIQRAWTWLKNEILTYPMWLPATLAAVIAQGTTLGWWTLDPTQTGEVTALVVAVFGLGAAFLTTNVGVTVIVTVLQAIGAVCVGFTFTGSDKVALYIGAVVAFLGFLGHTQNSPKFGPRSPRQLVPQPEGNPPEGASQVTQPASSDLMHSVTATGEPVSVPDDTVTPNVDVGTH